MEAHQFLCHKGHFRSIFLLYTELWAYARLLMAKSLRQDNGRCTGPLAQENGGTGRQQRFEGGYEWRESDNPTFFPGRHADIYVKGQHVGEFGVVHPNVLAKFDAPFPASALELNIEPFCYDQLYKALPTHMQVEL